MIHKSIFSSKSVEWGTPDWLFKSLDAEFSFTLDPCCTDDNAKCNFHFTLEDDGLSKDWADNSVFMNPPYGRSIGDWMKKAFESSRNGATSSTQLFKVVASLCNAWRNPPPQREDQVRRWKIIGTVPIGGDCIPSTESPNQKFPCTKGGGIVLLTVKQVAHRLSVSQAVVYRLIDKKKLAAHRIGLGSGAIRISEDQLAQYLEASLVEETQPSVPKQKLKHIKF